MPVDPRLVDGLTVVVAQHRTKHGRPVLPTAVDREIASGVLEHLAALGRLMPVPGIASAGTLTVPQQRHHDAGNGLDQ